MGMLIRNIVMYLAWLLAFWVSHWLGEPLSMSLVSGTAFAAFVYLLSKE